MILIDILQSLAVTLFWQIDRNENAEHSPSKILMGKKKKSENEWANSQIPKRRWNVHTKPIKEDVQN